MRLIDADLLEDKCNNRLWDDYEYDHITSFIAEIPTVEITNADDYQKAALRTASVTVNKDTHEDTQLINGLMGLCGESGECIDILKKSFFQGHELDKHHLAEELGDVAWYLAVAAHALGYKLSDIMEMNVEKLMKRYPDGFDSERSVNREDFAENIPMEYFENGGI